MMTATLDVTFDTLGTGPSDFMPLGNGETCANVWTEPDGSICLYIARTDAWSEIARLLKVGKARVRLDSPLSPATSQRLDVGTATIHIVDGARALRIWIDAHAQVVVIEVDSPKPVVVTSTLEPWRTSARTITDPHELHSAYGMQESNRPATESADIVEQIPAGTLSYHRNTHSIWPTVMAHQGMGDLVATMRDPLQGRCFGLLLSTPSTTPSTRHVVTIATHCTQSADFAAQISQIAARWNHDTIDGHRAAHEKWWADFWNRSHITIAGDDRAAVVTRGYALQRFMQACAGRGAFPLKFNGGHHTVDADEMCETFWRKRERFNVDYRRWGGPYWCQNTRHMYWPMLMAGDFDCMTAFFDLYRNALPVATHRVRTWFGHEGATFPETMEFWGSHPGFDYGWDRTDSPTWYVKNTYTRYYVSGILEVLTMMLRYVSASGDQKFVTSTLLPIAEQVILYYDQHFPRDLDGKLRIEPASALESYQTAVTPTPELAGLQVVIDGIQSFDLSPRLRTVSTRLRSILPPIPTRKDGDQLLFEPAYLYGDMRNMENPALYAVFPYFVVGIDHPQLDAMRATFNRRVHKSSTCWSQCDIHAALLGLTGEARDRVAERFSKSNPKMKFPAMWGPNYDWTPDMDHGGAGMMALQSMLLQLGANGTLHLLPAWPADWDVDFKLHADRQTVVECVVRSGKIVDLRITPEARRADLRIHPAFAMSPQSS
jgi:alpha-L-fucosidase 2